MQSRIERALDVAFKISVFEKPALGISAPADADIGIVDTGCGDLLPVDIKLVLRNVYSAKNVIVTSCIFDAPAA